MEQKEKNDLICAFFPGGAGGRELQRGQGSPCLKKNLL